MNSKAAKITGWVMSVVLTAFLILASASGKFTEWEGKAEAFEQFGYTEELMVRIGVVEVIVAIMILVPRINFVGALLLTAYLGGATATHVRIGDPFVPPVVVGVFLWTAMCLRRPDVFAAVIGSPRPETSPPE